LTRVVQFRCKEKKGAGSTGGDAQKKGKGQTQLIRGGVREDAGGKKGGEGGVRKNEGCSLETQKKGNPSGGGGSLCHGNPHLRKRTPRRAFAEEKNTGVNLALQQEK